MTHSNLQRRSALHGNLKRRFHPGRAGPLLPIEGTLTPTPTPPAPAKNTPATPTTPATTDKSGLVSGIVSVILSPPVIGGSTTSKSSSTTTSTSSVSATSSVTTSSLPTHQETTHSVPTITSATPHVVVQTAPSVSSPTSIHANTPSETAQASTGISAVTVISGIGGALAATILLTFLIGFILRRWRRNRSAEDSFDANQFRRSGIVIDEKLEDDNTHDYPRPRPPTMIERRNTPSPPAAYPYADEPPLAANEHAQSFAQFEGIPKHPSFAAGNQFGAPAMDYGANPHAMDYGQGTATYSGLGEGPGYGAPPVPGTHGPGAYAPYGVDPRYPQSQRYPRPQQYQNQQPQHQQNGFGQGPAIDTPTSAATRDEDVSNLANPFSPLRVSKKLTRMSTEEGSGPEPLSTRTISPSPTPPPSSTNPGAATSPFVTRQSREVPPSYTNNGEYADVQRDVKMSPALLNIVNRSSDAVAAAVPPTDAAAAATTVSESNGRQSQYTIYGDDDVYGGM